MGPSDPRMAKKDSSSAYYKLVPVKDLEKLTLKDVKTLYPKKQTGDSIIQ